MLKIVEHKPIVLFIPTIGCNDRIFKAIDNARENFKEAFIVVWNDCCCNKQIQKLDQVADEVIISNNYIGPNRAAAFGALCLEYDYFVFSADDTIFPLNYWQMIWDYFCKYKPLAIGENHRVQEIVEPVKASEDFYWDGPFIVPQKTIREYGSFTPHAGYYGFGMMKEFQKRLNHDVLIVRTGVQNLGSEGRNFAISNMPEGFIKGEMERGELRAEEYYKKWWQI